ncbi:YadA-like family protein [Actinobacillus lignieresii]|uniref:YadA-like family protein n=2 Tax=Actinobacillus TaxID=713 RepID=UPI003CC8204A
MVDLTNRYPKTQATGAASVAVGVQAIADHLSTAFGTGTLATGIASTALGVTANASGIGSFAGGPNAAASGRGAIAIGAYSKSIANESVALGTNSVADREVSTDYFTLPQATDAQKQAIVATKATKAAVSVGSDTIKRQIINVAAGSQDSDAVNVAQLKAASTTIKAGSNVNVAKTTDANGAVYTINAYNTTVAKGSDDVVVTSSQQATNTTLYTVDIADTTKQNIQKGVDAKVATDKGIRFGNSTTSNKFELGSTIKVNAGDDIVVNTTPDGVQVALADNVDVNNITVGNTLRVGDVSVNQAGISAGNKKITNVENGTQTKDAVNFGQLEQVKNLANAGWNLQANGQNGSTVRPTETVSLNNTDNNIMISKDANNDNVTFGLNSTLTVGQTKPITMNGTTGTISGLSSTLPVGTGSTVTSQTKPATTASVLSSAATVGDVLNSGWNLQGNSQAVDFVSAYDTVNFVSGSGTTAEVTVDAGKASSTVKYSVNKSDLSVTGGTVTAGKAGDNFATAEQVAKAINDSEKTSSVVSSTKTIKVTSKVDGKNTEYDLDLSEATKTSLQNADNALQSWTAQANGQAVKTVSKDNATLNFVDGTNIQVTNDKGQVKIATVDTPTFTTVNAENFTTGTVSITDNGINAGNQKITNLANGTANSDAVTLAQLNASKSVVKAGNNTNVRTETATDGSTVYTVDANATTVSGSDALNITKSDAGNNVTNYALDLSKVTKDNIQKGVDAHNTVTTEGLTFTADSGTDTLRKLGETLAINGDATLINTKVEAGKVSVVATKTLTDAVSNATSALQSIVTTADSKDAQTVNKDSNKANFISGTNIQLTPSKDGIIVATKESVDFTTVNATTVNATTVNGDTIKSGNVVINQDGINAGGQTISNVKAGDKGTDAVNVNQLNEVKNTVNAGWMIQANGQNGSNVKPNETVSLNNTDNNIVISKTADNDNVTFALNNTLNIGNTKPIKIDGTTGTISGLVSTLPTSSTLTAQTKPTTTDTILSSAATVGDVLNSGWNLQGNSQEVDFVSAYDTVNFVSGSGATAEVTVDAGKAASTVKYSVNKSELSVTGGTVTAGKAGDNFATAEQVAKAINDSEKTSSVVSTTQAIKVTPKVSGNNTEYDLDLSEATKTSLQKADSALQSWTAQANGQDVKTVSKDNATLNFVNGTNIQVTNDNGQVKIATVDAPTFTTVTAGTVNAENFTTGTVSITDNGINAGNQKITNLANGTANSDAVTLAQLNASKSVVQAGNNTHVRSETVTDGSTVYTVDANATTVSGSDALNITKSDAGNNVTNYALDLSDKTKGEIKQGVDANTTVNTKGLTFTADSGTDTLRKLGETLAINGDATLINTKVEAGKVSVVATKTLTDAVTNATSALQSIVTTADSKDAQTVNKDSNKANFISGTNIQLTPSKDGITVATKESVDFTTVNATTVNATTVNGDTIKSGDVVITKNGINAGDKKITHVADGNVTNDSKEAVNGSQLYATNQNVTNNTNNIAKNTADIAKGTVYAGDVGNSFTRPLGETTNVKGGAKDNLSDNNIGVVSDGTDTLTVKLAKTLTDLTSAEFGEKDSSDKTVINKDGVSSELIGKDGNVISSTDLTSDGVTSESVIPETQTSSTETADDGTTTQTDTTTDGLDSNAVSSQGMTVSTSTTETKTKTVTPKDGTPETTVVETDTVKTTGVDNDGIRINTHETVTTTNPDGTTNVVENGGEVSLTSSGLNNGGNRAINVAAGVNATDAVNVSQLEAAKTHYYSVKTTTEQANFNNDTATGENSIAAGPNVWAQGVQSAVFGSMAGALGDKSTAMGNDAWALGTQATAIGSGVEAHGQGSVAIGNADNNGKDKTIATNEAINSVAIGTHAVVTKADTVAIGHNAGAVNIQATALGANANAAGEQSNALGYKSSASGHQSTAVGTEANAAGQEATALGYKANSNGYRTTAIGHSSSATGSMAVALGNQANARGTLSQAFGDHAIASAENATAIGTNANANAEKGIAFGTQAGVSGVSGIAFGDGAMSNAKQAISIGKSARTTTENAVALGSSAIATSNNAIAVGNSSNAIGANSLAMGVNSKALKDNTIALGNNVSVTAANAVALGLNSTAYGENSIVMGTSAKNTGNHAVAIGTGASAYRQNSIAMGKDSSTGGDFAVALGDSANAAAENTLALGKNAVADKKDSVALGNNAYTGDVIATESATLAGQVYEFAGKAPIGTVSVGNQGNERTITNVAAGRISSTSTDAINGSQLYAVSEVASRGWNIQANGDKESQVAPGATVQFIDGTNIDITHDGNNITIATAENVVTTDTDKYVTGGSVTYDDKGNATTTLTGNNGAGGTVTGVKNNFVTEAETAKDGKTATLTRNDGGKVNIDLTNTVNQAVTEATEKGTHYEGDKPDTGATANNFKRKLGETTKVLGGAQGELSDNNIGVVSNGSDTLTVKLAKSLTDLTNAIFGSNDDKTVINKDGVTITNGADANKTVSLTDGGLNNGGNKITNVAKGDADTDAVNVSQLNQAIKDSSYNWNISDGKTEQTVPDNGKVSVKGSANDDSKATSGIVTTLTGTDITVDLSDKSKQDIADGKKHSSVEGDANVVVTQTATNKDGGKQYDVKLADKVSIGSDKATTVTIDGTKGTVSGLTNTTWDPNKEYTGGQAATQEQLKSVSDVANSGWNISANGQNESNVGPKGKVSFNNTDGNVLISKETTDNNVTFNLNNDLTVGGAGKDGKDGKDGTLSVKGADGKTGVTLNGKDGSIGLTGAPGKDGQDAQATIKVVDGTKGLDGNNGKDGESKTRIVYEKPNGGGEEEIATLNDGLNFVGDKGQVIQKKLNETLAIKGNLDAAAVVTDKNLRVDNDKGKNGELIIKMAKSLTDLTNATFGSDDSSTVIGGNGLTITPKAGDKVSLTDKGLDNGNNTITNVKAGENDTDAVNVSQLKEVKNTANAGWNISANGQNETNVAPKGSVSFNNTDGNVVITKAADNNNVTFNLNNDLTVGGPAGKDGKDGKDGTIGVKGKDGTTGVTLNGKDGSIGLTGAKGADGKDGANATITVANGPVGVDGTDGKDGKDGMTRIVYTDPKGTTHNVSTLNDGLNFVGNQGDTIAKKLNETLTVKGDLANNAAASSENLRVDSQDGALVVKLAQNLANLTTATFGNTDTDNTVVSKDGVTISSDKPEKEVSLTDKGLNNGNNQITNVTSGLTDSTGQKSDLANATTTNAVNVGDLKDTVNNLTNATTGGFGLKDDNNTEVKQDLGKTIQIKGKDGVTVTSDVANKSLEVALQGDVTVNGKDGKDGSIGVKGADGKDGTKITKDAVVFNGVDGKDGKDGQVSIKVEQGEKGIAGNDGANGTTKTRIVYEKPNGDKEQVATLNDGLKFVGDTGEVIAKKLNETLAIKGNLTATAAVTDKNLRVDNENGQLIVKMAKSLTDLTNATFGSDNSNTTIGGNGVTITPNGGDAGNTVSLTDKGLNNGNNQVTNVSTGLKDRDGNNVTLANASGDVLNNAVNVGDLKDSVNNLTNATTGGFGLTDEKGNDVKADLGKTVTVQGDGSVKTEVVEKDGKKALQIGLTNNVTVGNDKEPGTITVKGENGKDGVSISGKDGIGIKGENGQDAVSINGKDGDGTVAVKGKDGKTGVALNGKDGTIGINGKDGSNGTITVKQGKPGVDGKDGETKTRIVYETKDETGKPTTEEVATLNDGLNFVGNDGKVIAKKLNETLAIKGNLSTAVKDVTANNLRVDNVGDELIINMAKALTDLTSATFTNKDGNKSVVDGNGLTITPKGGNASNTVSLTTTGLNNGGNKVINVAAGDVNANSTDAVNGSQLYAVSEVANKGWNIQTNGNDTTNVKPGDTVNFVNGDNIAITNDGTKVTVGLVKQVDLGKDGSIKAGDTLVNNEGVKVGDNVSLTKDGLKAGNVTISATTGINAGDKQITNVASGLGGTKLSEAKGDTLTNAANIGDLQTAVSSVTDASKGGGFGLADDKGANVTQNLGKTIAVKGDGKNISTVVKGGALTVNLNKDVDLGKGGSVTTGNTKVSDKGVSFADSLVNLTSNGLDNGGNKVTNVKAGDVNANSTDAVNGSQLYATNQNVTNVQNEVAKGWNIEAGTVDGGKVFNASKTKVAMGDTVGVKAGKNIEITQDGSNIAIATSANPTFETVTTESVKVGKGDNTVAIETVTDKHGSALKVSGADGKSETRINNVADGKADNDAVNVRQLRGVAQNVANIDNRVSKLDKRVRGIGANAAAASSLPQVYIPGKSMVALAGGAYSGASAVAVGYSRASDNGKVILKVNGTANSAGHYSGGVGVGYQW